MGLYFMLSVMFAIGGIFHIAQIIWTMICKDALLLKYKDKAITRDAILKFEKPTRLVVATGLTITATFVSIYLVQQILDTYGRSSGSEMVITYATIGGLLAIGSVVYTYFLLYKNSK